MQQKCAFLEHFGGKMALFGRGKRFESAYLHQKKKLLRQFLFLWQIRKNLAIIRGVAELSFLDNEIIIFAFANLAL